MATTERREHERIEIRMAVRMWLDEQKGSRPIAFEGFATTRDLSIGGCFLESTYLLPSGYPLNLEMRMEEGELLRARGEIVHRLQNDAGRPTGMGILFTEVDAENRERLLRYFVSDRIKDFYFNRFIVEFPHLESVITLKDVALTINLWEDKEGRLSALRHPEGAKAQQARRRDEAAAAAGRRKVR